MFYLSFPTLPVCTRVLPPSLALSLLCSINLCAVHRLSLFFLYVWILSFFWLLIISACTVFSLISFSRLHAVFFSFFSRPISLLSIRVLPSLWSRDPVLSLLWLLLYKAVLLSSLLLFFFSSFFSSLTTHSVYTLNCILIHLQIAMAGAKRKLDTAPAPSPSQGASQSTSSNTTSHVFHVSVVDFIHTDRL